jgi:hypothetical protein
MGTPDCDKTRSTSNDNEAPISHRSKRPRITLATTRDVGVFRTLARNRQHWVAPSKRTTSPGGSSSARGYQQLLTRGRRCSARFEKLGSIMSAAAGPGEQAPGAAPALAPP